MIAAKHIHAVAPIHVKIAPTLLSHIAGLFSGQLADPVMDGGSLQSGCREAPTIFRRRKAWRAQASAYPLISVAAS